MIYRGHLDSQPVADPLTRLSYLLIILSFSQSNYSTIIASFCLIFLNCSINDDHYFRKKRTRPSETSLAHQFTFQYLHVHNVRDVTTSGSLSFDFIEIIML
jgi:hypothetical protein